jgi:hypothetical protein
VVFADIEHSKIRWPQGGGGIAFEGVGELSLQLMMMGVLPSGQRCHSKGGALIADD